MYYCSLFQLITTTTREGRPIRNCIPNVHYGQIASKFVSTSLPSDCTIHPLKHLPTMPLSSKQLTDCIEAIHLICFVLWVVDSLQARMRPIAHPIAIFRHSHLRSKLCNIYKRDLFFRCPSAVIYPPTHITVICIT